MPYRILLIACLLLPQASTPVDEWTALWQSGFRARGIERLLIEVQAPTAKPGLWAQLVTWELQTSQFEAALKHSEGLAESNLGLRGRALYFLTRYEESLLHLRVEHPEEILMRVEALRALGRLSEQDKLLPKLRETFGINSPQVLIVEARSFQRNKQYAEAVEKYASVRKHDPLHAEALFGQGQCLLRLKQRDQAMVYLEAHRRMLPLLDKLDFAQRGVGIAPRSASNHAALAQAWQALIQMDPSVQEKAAQAFERAAQLASVENCAPIALRHGRFHLEVRKDVDAATRVLTAAYAKCKDVRLLVRNADYHEAAGQFEQALQALGTAAKLRPGDMAIQQRIARIKAR
jgi:tetratricopeptide (TPR) repeat protein